MREQIKADVNDDDGAQRYNGVLSRAAAPLLVADQPAVATTSPLPANQRSTRLQIRSKLGGVSPPLSRQKNRYRGFWKTDKTSLVLLEDRA